MKSFKLILNLFLILLVFTSLVFAEEPLEMAELTDQTQEVITEEVENEESIPEEEIAPESEPIAESTELNYISVTYQTHVQDYGWREICSDGQSAGSIGENRRMEAIQISSPNLPALTSIEYSAHVQNVGWTNYVRDGATSGTEGQALAIEAIKIRLVGTQAPAYNIYYRAHVSNFGWLGWTCNDGISGTTGYGNPMEAIQIVIYPKEESAPGPTGNASMERARIDAGDYGFDANTGLSYQAYISNYAWQNPVLNGATAGTTGISQSLEKFRATTSNLSGGIRYAAYLSNIGWQPVVAQNQEAGLSDAGVHVETIVLDLEGDIANQFNLYYRVHVSNLGWLDWVHQGEYAGTVGHNYPIEAFEIRMLPKPVPGPSRGLDMGFINYDMANKPKVPPMPGCPSLKNFLATALSPVGTTSYILGGGWSGGVGVTIGKQPQWERFYNAQNANYNYEDHLYETYNGLDCSGYVGWVVYNTINNTNGRGNEVYLADREARMYAEKGYGVYFPYQSFTTFQPGDIVSLNYDAHVYICLGQCADGSVLLVHSSPPGVMITGTTINGQASQATMLSHRYMKAYYPDYYRKYHSRLNRNAKPYLTNASKFQWRIISDPDNLRVLDPASVLRIMFNE